MRQGLYGKLPAKRDFIAEGLPPGFLAFWEPWLQGGLAASKMDLGSQWRPTYLAAPIWRFWLGPLHCGRTVIGAVMPSVDGIGRYFPMTLVSWMEDEETAETAIASPAENANETWFEAAEDLLLSMLGDGVVFEDLLARVAALPPPDTTARPRLPEGARLAPDGRLVVVGAEATAAAAFEGLRAARAAADYAGDLFWWTIGGGGFPAVATRGRRMPEPHGFSTFLTGRFEA